MNQYPNLLLTLGLAGLLLPPFGLKILASSLEPYPAVILPAGAHQIELDSSKVNFTRTSLWGKKLSDNSWVRIDSEKLLDPIPNEYLGHIVNNSFGLESKVSKTNSTLKRKITAILRSKITANEIEDTKNWLRHKLAKFNCSVKELMVAEEKIIFDVNIGKTVSLEIIDEKIFELD